MRARTRPATCVVLAAVLSACTPPPAVERRVEASRRPEPGSAAAPAGLPFYGGTRQFLSELANLIAAGMEGVTGREEIELVDEERVAANEESRAIGRAYRAALSDAFEATGHARGTPGGVRVSVEVLRAERWPNDHVLVTIRTIVRSARTDEVIADRLDTAWVRNLDTEPSVYRTARPPRDQLSR